MDVGVSHEQHGQRVHLGRVAHEDAAVGLDGHEVGEPAAVELGRLPAGAALSALPGPTQPPPRGTPVPITHLLMVDLCSSTVPALVRYA